MLVHLASAAFAASSSAVTTLATAATRRLVLGLCRVSLGGDVHERAADWTLPLPLSRGRARRIARIRAAGVLFIHIPKCAGMAISRSLYGAQIKHGSIRWYRQCAPELDALPSFAVLRDPVERFVSAYRYAIAGGSRDNRVSPAFRDRYRAFRCLDDALDHVEAAGDPYRLDHIFRPQSWYVTDRTGAVAVDRLFDLADPALPCFLRDHGGGALTQVNRSAAPCPDLNGGQIDRILRLYRDDALLHARVLRAQAGANWRAGPAPRLRRPAGMLSA